LSVGRISSSSEWPEFRREASTAPEALVLSAAVPFRFVPAGLELREMMFAEILVLLSKALDQFAGSHGKRRVHTTDINHVDGRLRQLK
jgi:hypothetical protein